MSGGEVPCRFFDTEGVLLEEAAGDIEAHLAGCAYCQKDRRRVAAVREELRRIPLPADTGHWEQAVFARIASTEAARRRRRRLFLVVPFLGAALFGIFMWLRPPERQATEPLLAIHYERGAEQMRTGDAPTKGATMVVSASGLDAPHRQLRVYRDGAGLDVQCSDQPPCTPRPDGLGARWTIPAEGTYRLVLVTSAAPLPTATGGYEADIVALRKAGANVIEELVEVY